MRPEDEASPGISVLGKAHFRSEDGVLVVPIDCLKASCFKACVLACKNVIQYADDNLAEDLWTFNSIILPRVRQIHPC